MLQRYKKGLLANLIKLIISSIILVGLIYLGISIYRGFIGNQEENQAKATLNNIVNLLSKLKEGETKSILLLAPVGWKLVSFDISHSENQEYKRPSSFWNQNTLCICKKKECKICKVIDKPLMYNDALALVEISINEILVKKEKEKYVLLLAKKTGKTDEDIKPVSDDILYSLNYQPSEFEMDEWFEKNTPYMKGLGECIRHASDEYNIPEEVIIAVAIHESGKEEGSDLANQCNNLFGIKYVGQTNKNCVLKGWEVIDGNRIEYNIEWAKFDNKCESVLYFARLIDKSKYYKEARKYRDNPQKMIEEIGKVYATDPEWAEKVIARMNEYIQEVYA